MKKGMERIKRVKRQNSLSSLFTNSRQKYSDKEVNRSYWEEFCVFRSSFWGLNNSSISSTSYYTLCIHDTVIKWLMYKNREIEIEPPFSFVWTFFSISPECSLAVLLDPPSHSSFISLRVVYYFCLTALFILCVVFVSLMLFALSACLWNCDQLLIYKQREAAAGIEILLLSQSLHVFTPCLSFLYLLWYLLWYLHPLLARKKKLHPKKRDRTVRKLGREWK